VAAAPQVLPVDRRLHVMMHDHDAGPRPRDDATEDCGQLADLRGTLVGLA